MDAEPHIPTDDIEACVHYVVDVFEAVVERYGLDVAQRIFTIFAKKPETKRELKLWEDRMILHYYYIECDRAKKSNRKPNVRQLAHRLGKQRGTDPIAMERKLWRVIGDKKLADWRQQLERYYNGGL